MFQKTLAALLVVVFFVPTSIVYLPERADANVVSSLSGAVAGAAACAVSGLVNSLGLSSVFGGLLVPVNPVPSEVRECTLDAIVWALANGLIDQIAADIVRWIESGFEGGPAFLTDPTKFFMDVADVGLGRFINSYVPVLCGPLRPQLQIVLSISRNSARYTNSRCTLTGVARNVESFLSGNFYSGGWQSFFNLQQNPYNNPIAAVPHALLRAELSMGQHQARALLPLNWGSGWFGQWTGGASGNSQITTPGAFVQEQVNRLMQGSQNRLEIADEVNEIVSALATQLFRSVFSSNSGLYNARGGQSYAVSYFNNYSAAITPNNFPSQQSDLLNRINAAITQTTSHQATGYPVSAELNQLNALYTTVASFTGMEPNIQTLMTLAERDLDRIVGEVAAVIAGNPNIGPTTPSVFSFQSTKTTLLNNIQNAINQANTYIAQGYAVQSQRVALTTMLTQVNALTGTEPNIETRLSVYQQDLTLLIAGMNNVVTGVNTGNPPPSIPLPPTP